MFVESALIYLVPTLVFIALCARRSIGQNLLFPVICQIQVCSVSFSGSTRAWADTPFGHLQPLSPLLVIMRVAQSRLLNKEGGVVTTDDILSGSAPRRPRLSLKLDFRYRDTSDLEGGATWSEAPMAPTTSRLPEPLPFVKVKSGPPSAIDMLDSEKMDELWKSQDLRRVDSRLASPSSSTPSYLPSYRSSREDLRIDEPRLHDPPGAVNTNSHNYTP
jgi:hypothetical protein